MQVKKINMWQSHHAALCDETKVSIRETIIAACEWSRQSFYRKMQAPDKLKYWEKQLVATSYGKKVEQMFPIRKEQALPL